MALALVRERLDVGDTPSEIGEHLEGAVADMVLPGVSGLTERKLMEDALALVDWAKVAQGYVDRINGTGWAAV